LIAALSAAGSFAFASSGAFIAVRDYGQAHQLGYMPYLPLIIWCVMTTFGVLNIIVFNRGAGSFSCLVMIFCLPSLLGLNTVDWPGVFGADFKFTTSLGFAGMMIIGLLVISGYVVLNYIRDFKQSEQNMVNRGATPADIEDVSSFSYGSLITSIAIAIAATALVAFLGRGLESIILNYLRKLPWNIGFIGLSCFMLLAFYIYWLGARRRAKNQPPDDIQNIFQ